MSSVVTWRLNLREIEIGKEVELTAEGLAAHEALPILITLPGGGTFLWGLQSDANGRIRETIKLDSGLGQYMFCPVPECYSVNPQCAYLNVCPCARSATDCNIHIEGPAHLLKQQTATYLISNLLPSRAVTVQIAANNQVTSIQNLVSDVNGELRYEFSWAMSGYYALTVSDGQCISAPKIIEVSENINFPSVLNISGYDDCQTPINISAVFDKAAYEPNTTGVLRVSVRNGGAIPRSISIAKSYNFGDGNITADAVPNAIYIGGYSVLEYIVVFNTGLSNKTLSGTFFGSYPCGGEYFSVNGAAFNAQVGVGEGVCSALLEYYGAETPGAEIHVNDEVNISIEVNNSGNIPLNDIKLDSFPLPTNAAFVSSFPLVSGMLAAGATALITLKVKFTATGTYTIHLPVGPLSYRCSSSGEYKQISQVGYVTFTVV